MKKLFLLFLFPLLVFGSPSWFYSLKQDVKSDIFGYGIAKDLKDAKQNAIAEITNTIYVSVDSSVVISNSDNNGKISEKTSTHLSTNSKAILSGVKFVKVEQIDDFWYVAAKYDNSAIDIKLKKLLPNNLKDEVQNNYLKYTPLISSLNKEIGKKLNYEIIRKDNLWQLKYKNILVPVNIKNFYKLFSTQSTYNLSIKANKKKYTENDEMYFNINHKKNGYLSILYVEHNGKVGVLLANKKSNKSFTYPDIKISDTFKVSNPYGKTIKELYVVLYSKSPINLHKFESVSDSLLDESNYNFDKLLRKFNEYNFSTYEIKIRK